MTLPNDTLVCDSARLASWQNNPLYDYNKELVAPDINLMEYISRWFARLMRTIFGSQFAEKYSDVFFILFFIAVILAIFWFLHKKRPELFMRSKKATTPYVVYEDNIYGVDFAAEIRKALAGNDYKNAVRYLYLQTLKYLSDNEFIDWQLYKTPTQYIYEIKADTKRTPFRELTNRFLRVRYGNYEADKALFESMVNLQNEVQKGATQV